MKLITALAAALFFACSGHAQVNSSWGPAVNHQLSGVAGPGFSVAPADPSPGVFNAIHMSLIPVPTGPSQKRGLVLVWDSELRNGSQFTFWIQRWSVLDCSGPYAVPVWNDTLTIQGPQGGDLFCSGHAWMRNGTLLVAGGTSDYVAAHQAWNAANISYVYDPTPTPANFYGSWTRLSDLLSDRWYPTVTLRGDGLMQVSGGADFVTQGTSYVQIPVNSYQLFDPSSGTWGPTEWPGPASSSGQALFTRDGYPRMHLLAKGELLVSGMARTASKLIDPVSSPSTWTNYSTDSAHFRHYGSSLLLPVTAGADEIVAIIGGDENSSFPYVTRDTVQLSVPQFSSAWVNAPSLIHKRAFLNPVALPDRTVLAIGGVEADPASSTNFFSKKITEQLYQGTWRALAAQASTRDYHSTAILLADGRVLSAGGESRDYDYEIFSPPYALLQEVEGTKMRAANVTVTGGPALTWNAVYTATFDSLSPGTSIDRIVLMSPGSITHHTDMSAHYVELHKGTQTSGSVAFLTPSRCEGVNTTKSCVAPGFHMLFLITTAGLVSHAYFVYVS